MLELKPLALIRATDLPKIAAPFFARHWLIGGGRNHVRGFEAYLTACIQEESSTHSPHGREDAGLRRLLDRVERGELVLVFGLWPLQSHFRAYEQKDNQWQIARLNVTHPDARRKLVAHTSVITQRQREEEAYFANRPPAARKQESDTAAGPGFRKPSLGPHEGKDAPPKQNTFKTQHEAVIDVSNKINPVSTSENREYGGMIYKNPDGTYSYTPPVKGTIDGVNPGGPSAVPPGATATAYYHTHGAYDPRYDNENFSGAEGDIGYADYYKIDGYLATPKGELKYYDSQTGGIQTIGKIKK